MIREYERYHGVVMERLVCKSGKFVSIARLNPNSTSSYLINSEVGIFVKYSTKRLSPWDFTFKKEHQNEILKMAKSLNKVFVVLVCGNDGVVCLSFDELKHLLDEHHSDYEWIGVWRNAREKYKIKGSDGKLLFKIGDNEFPSKLFN